MLSKPNTLTLFFTIALALATVSHATGSAAVNRRDHSNLTRFIKKRAPAQDSGVNLAGLVGAPDPAAPTQSSSTSSAGPLSPSSEPQESSSSSSATAPTTSSVPLASSSDSSSSSGSTTASAPASLASPSSNATSSVSLKTSSASSSTTSAAQTSQTLNIVGVSDTPVVSTPVNTHTITQTATGQAESATTASAPVGTTSSTKRTTITILIVIASSIAGVAVIWTIIRKWKFRPSSQFEDRMQPIDWQPTSNPDDGLASARRRLSNASSFHSGTGHGNIDNIAGRGLGYGATMDHSNDLAPLPDHDFTPGAATLAPVGGYADLARGPGPQPQMQQALRRGPSSNRPNFGVPIHHQAGYGAQDPYGGVY